MVTTHPASLDDDAYREQISHCALWVGTCVCQSVHTILASLLHMNSLELKSKAQTYKDTRFLCVVQRFWEAVLNGTERHFYKTRGMIIWITKSHTIKIIISYLSLFSIYPSTNCSTAVAALRAYLRVIWNISIFLGRKEKHFGVFVVDSFWFRLQHH